MANVVEHRKFICVCFEGSNNNKAWQISLFDNNDVKVEWGRVGQSYQSKVHNSAGRSKFQSLIHSKTNSSNADDKRYTEVKAVDSMTSSSSSSISTSSMAKSELKKIAKKQIKFNSAVVEKLVEFLTDVNAHNILTATGGSITYDTSSATFKTPMGIIVPEQVAEARDLLFDLAQMVKKNQQSAPIFSSKLNQYLRLIPHSVGMKKIDPYNILPNMVSVQKETDILDGLGVSFADVTTTKEDETVVETNLFDVNLHLTTDGKVIDNIAKQFDSTKNRVHISYNYKIKDVYEVIIGKMNNSFDSQGKKFGNIMQLWHGTKCSNLLSIMKQGLIIPPANSGFCTGRMFGDGLYFSDQSTKSLNYATGYWSGKGSTARIFMFLADVAMGKSFTPSGSHYGNYPPRGYDSTFAKAQTSGVQNNEMIVYKTCQANLRYLVEFKER